MQQMLQCYCLHTYCKWISMTVACGNCLDDYSSSSNYKIIFKYILRQ